MTMYVFHYPGGAFTRFAQDMTEGEMLTIKPDYEALYGVATVVDEATWDASPELAAVVLDSARTTMHNRVEIVARDLAAFASEADRASILIARDGAQVFIDGATLIQTNSYDPDGDPAWP